MELEAYRALQTSVKISDSSLFSLDIAVEDPTYNIVNEVAIIPIKGIISKGVSDIEKIFFNVIDIDNISDMFSKAIKDDLVKSIVLDLNSPGGSVSGVPELYDRIKVSSKPVVSFTDEQCASGAYWLAAGSSAIYATKSADVGSVGCFASILDCSKFFENQGFKNEVIVSTGSKFKAAGMPGTSLTDVQREEIQAGVDYVSDMFKSDILFNRKIDFDDMRGQTFMGEQAEKTGYVDNIVDSISTAIVDSLVLCGSKDKDKNK